MLVSNPRQENKSAYFRGMKTSQVEFRDSENILVFRRYLYFQTMRHNDSCCARKGIQRATIHMFTTFPYSDFILLEISIIWLRPLTRRHTLLFEADPCYMDFGRGIRTKTPICLVWCTPCLGIVPKLTVFILDNDIFEKIK